VHGSQHVALLDDAEHPAGPLVQHDQVPGPASPKLLEQLLQCLLRVGGDRFVLQQVLGRHQVAHVRGVDHVADVGQVNGPHEPVLTVHHGNVVQPAVLDEMQDFVQVGAGPEQPDVGVHDVAGEDAAAVGPGQGHDPESAQ